MKSKSYKNSHEEETKRTNLWDAFVTHLETIYFPGASELLDKQTIAFEYQAFTECYA